MASEHTRRAATLVEPAQELGKIGSTDTETLTRIMDAIAQCETALALHRIADAMEGRNREEGKP